MLVPAHAGISWVLGNCAREDHRFRLAVFLAGVLPDLDGIGLFFSSRIYCAYHHLLTHGLVFSLLLSGLGMALCRRKLLKVVLFTQLSFHIHYFGDYFLTRWELYYFYPFSRLTFTSTRGVGLYHPVNYMLVWISLVAVIVIMILCKRTPIELISPRLDRWCMDKLARLFRAGGRGGTRPNGQSGRRAPRGDA